MDDERESNSSPGACTMCLAIPARIIEFPADQPSSALVDVMGVRRRVDLSLLQDDPAQLNDWVLIHVGFALSKVSEQDALEQLKTLRALGESEAALREVRGLQESGDKAG
jgi:hydrogenase expression/formation protein HypC